ncbi:MAG: recombinase family protein, partial [Gammaproteobacteria bacterium]
VRCGSCATTLMARPHNGQYPDGEQRRQYFCGRAKRGACGKVAVDMRAVDRELRELVVARLSDSRHAAAIAAARAQVADRLSAVDAEIAEIEQLQRALSDRLGRREISLESFDVANRPLAQDLARLVAEREQLADGSPAGPVQAMSAHAVAQQWDDPDTAVAERRAMVTAALGGSWLAVDPAVKAPGVKRVFDRRRLRLVKPAEFRAA